jgi:hypothetical protein
MLDLLPVALRPMLPDLYAQEQEPDPMVYARFHTTNDEYQWFLTEFSQKDQDTCFGYIVSADGTELGYFSLTYLQLADMPLEQFRLGNTMIYVSSELRPDVQRDNQFTPQKWSIVRKEFEV